MSKQVLKDTMRFGKVQFEIEWSQEMPFDLEKPENAPFKAMFKQAFETAKTTLAGKAKKAYAAAIGKKVVDFKTEMADDPEEAAKHWKAVVAGTDYSVSNFRDYVPQSEGQIAVAKVLAWLQSLGSEMPVGEIIEGMDAASLKSAILGE